MSGSKLEKQIEDIKNEFSSLTSWEEKYKRVIEFGRKNPVLPESEKTEEAKVKGCQSQVWLHAKLEEDGRILFWGESDALIVNGLLAVLLQIYNHSEPEEILKSSPDFIKDIGFSENLSPSRANGLVAMVKQIRNFAHGFQILRQMSQRR